MNQNQTSPFIFYLTFGDALPSSFYAFDLCFKQLGYVLVPVKVDQLQLLASSSDQQQLMVITSVSSAQEFKLYGERVRKSIRMILKSRRITFFLLSSFGKLNDQKLYGTTRNYHFLKLPINAAEFAGHLADYFEQRETKSYLWPGGRRVNLRGTEA